MVGKVEPWKIGNVAVLNSIDMNFMIIIISVNVSKGMNAQILVQGLKEKEYTLLRSNLALPSIL